MTKSEAEIVKGLIKILPLRDADSVDTNLDYRIINLYQLEEFCQTVDAMVKEESLENKECIDS